jgi:hypothetical protein
MRAGRLRLHRSLCQRCVSATVREDGYGQDDARAA